jgi:hypothetical protein
MPAEIAPTYVLLASEVRGAAALYALDAQASQPHPLTCPPTHPLQDGSYLSGHTLHPNGGMLMTS